MRFDYRGDRGFRIGGPKPLGNSRMWFRKDPDAWLHDMIAADARRKGDDDVTVRQKVEAVRAEISERRAADQAYYDHAAADARAAGDDFITVDWKLDVARAKRHLDR